VTGDLILYDYDGSPCARRVRVTMIEKSLNWRRQTVDLSRLEQRHPRYLAINPNGLVPTLAHGPRVIWESNVITEYLDDVFPEKRLYPLNPIERAEVKKWQAAELAMAKDYRPVMYQRLMGPLIRATHSLDEALAVARRSTADPADLAWEEKVWSLAVLTPDEEAKTEQRLYDWLVKLERALGGREWLVGNGFTQAEISVYPRVLMFPYIGLKIDSRYPNVRAWMARLRNRPSFTQTMSKNEARMAAFASGPLPRFLRRTLRKTDAERSALESLWLTAVRSLLRRARRDARGGSETEFLKPSGNGVSEEISRLTETMPLDGAISLAGATARPETQLVRAALRELELPFDDVADDARQLPLLRHGAMEIEGAQSIVDYLDTLDTEEQLLPGSAFDAANVRMWLAFDAGMHKEFEPLYRHTARGGEAPSNADAANMRRTLQNRVDRLASELESRPWICGAQYTIADAALVVRLEAISRLGVEPFATRPALARWAERVRPHLRG
jgi:glutathione S-transferase